MLVDVIISSRTYKSSTWFAKPSIISPLCCARYGWINISSDTLKCVSCNKEITHERGLAPTPNMLTSLGDYSGEEFAEKLITAHDPRACGWINDDQTPISYNFSPESFLYFPNQTLDARLLTFQSRFVAWYHQLIASSAQIQVPREISEWRSFYLFIHDSLSPSSTSLTLESKEEPQHKFDLRLKQYLLSLLKNSGVTISDSVLLDAFILSLYCWDLTKSQPNSPPCSSCSMCGRNFSMCTTSERNQVVNPSQEHKYYCPVVSSYVPPPSSSCSEPVPSGYLQMIEALLMSIMDWKVSLFLNVLVSSHF